MKSRFCRLFAIMLAVATAIAGCNGDAGPRRQFMSLATAGTGGLYYPIGGALASRLTARDTGRTWTAEVTGGSVENIQRLVRGEVDLAMAIGTTIHEAYHGGRDFVQPQTRLRTVAPLYPNLTHVLVRDGANITSIDGFRGMRVSVGAAGSGTEQVSRQLLEAYGLAYDDIAVRYLSFTESASALADGAIDAAILSVGYPASAVLEAMTTGRIRLVPIDGPRIEQMTETWPYYSSATIPAGVYPGVDAAVPTVSVLNWIVALDDLDDDVVGHVLDILAEDADALREAVEIAGQIRLTNLFASPVPLHDSARAWVERTGPAGQSTTGSQPEQ
ncbi:MAG TPA: TAXI family TRAP transporter solute-binding subunit [Longimicrobiales bacterium]|nr:TAXI family TRAP transporter solute-binding subunit [Longimicrobiales bacterium]